MAIFSYWILTTLTFTLCLYLPTLSAGPLQLISTESDPDAFIQKSVNVINGDYCESNTDLVITGPDSLMLQRFFSTQDAFTGKESGGWRIFPQRFLMVGKDLSKKSCVIDQDRFEWIWAFTGERSGGILPYGGWRNIKKEATKDPLKIHALDTAGIVNTYAKEMNGQTNHLNNQLYLFFRLAAVALASEFNN